MYSFESKNTLLSFEIDVINMEPFLDDANSSNFFLLKTTASSLLPGRVKETKCKTILMKDSSAPVYETKVVPLNMNFHWPNWM